MRGFRFVVVALVTLALLLNDSPTSDGRSAIQPQLSTTQTLRSWDGRGLAIPDRTNSDEEVQADFRHLGGLRVVLQVDEAALLKNLLTTVRDDVRHLLRAARIGFIGLTVRDGGIEVRIRKNEDLPRALAAFGTTQAQPDKALNGAFNMRVDGDKIRFAPTDVEFDDLLRATVTESIRTVASCPCIRREADWSQAHRVAAARVRRCKSPSSILVHDLAGIASSHRRCRADAGTER
jgi:hypothetical protein